MKTFSGRQPRYRRRFLTLTRTCRPQLQRLVSEPQLPHVEEERSQWAALFHGLCLKSAQEVGATQDGQRQAATRFQWTLRSRGARVVPLGP